MNGSIRLGIIGMGKISAESHLPAVLAIPGVELAGVVDIATARVNDLVSRLGIRPRVSDTIDEILPLVDAVIIATPNSSHAEFAIQCLNAGAHVLVEKPLANTVEEGEQIVTAAQESGRVLAVGYCTRFFEAVRLMRTLIEKRFFGRIRRFAYQFGVVGGWASESGFHLDRRTSGGGVLVTTGTHFLDRMLYWFGYPDSCELRDDSLGGPEANAVARFRWESMEGSARFSKTVRLTAGLVMETDRGTVVLHEGIDEAIRLREAKHPEVEYRLVPRTRSHSGKADMFGLQLEDFLRACQTGVDPLVTGRQAVEVIRIVQDLYAARSELASDWYGESG